jgi:hypothetical protein
MPTRILFLLALVGSGVFLLSGAWSSAPADLPPEPETPFVAQTVPLEDDIIGSGIDAGQLLQKAVERLDPGHTVWLKTKIRQTMTDEASSFVAEGVLQRGPNHCAHLQMETDALGKKRRLLVVSDGEVVAQVRQVPGAEDVVEVVKVPAGDVRSRETFLVAKSCGGPRPVLESLQKNLKDGRLQTGLLHDVPVIVIKGEFESDVKGICAGVATPVKSATIYLDAKSLWPVRLEWWGVDSKKAPRRVLCIEFLEPELNRELSLDECVKVFSYRPANEPGQ